MKLAAPLALAAALAFPAAALAQNQLTPNCNKTTEEDPCKIVITMSAGCGSGIKVTPDPIVVPRRTPVFIEWEIQTEAWAFEGPGIFIHQGERVMERKTAGPKKLKVKNHNQGTATFKYDIILTGPGGVCKLDPTIINQ